MATKLRARAKRRISPTSESRPVQWLLIAISLAFMALRSAPTPFMTCITSLNRPRSGSTVRVLSSRVSGSGAPA